MFDFAAMPKYCINLSRRPDRKAHSVSEFRRLGLDVEFVTAVDANDIVLPELSIKAGEYYAKGNWACVLSHLSIINRQRTEYVFICEDDVAFCEGFHERMAQLEKWDSDFDIFYVGGGNKETDRFEKIDNQFYRVKAMAGTCAYILRKPAGEFIARNITYDWGVDQFYSEVLLSRFYGVTCLPMMATTFASDSDIGGPNTAR